MIGWETKIEVTENKQVSMMPTSLCRAETQRLPMNEHV